MVVVVSMVLMVRESQGKIRKLEKVR